MIVLFVIWISLLVYSLGSSAKRASGLLLQLNIADFKSPDYTFGLHHQRFVGTARQDGEIFQINTITIGFALFALEIQFFRPHEISPRQD